MKVKPTCHQLYLSVDQTNVKHKHAYSLDKLTFKFDFKHCMGLLYKSTLTNVNIAGLNVLKMY